MRMPCHITDERVVDLMPRLDLNRYWVEVLMDDGSQIGFATEGYTMDDAEEQACMDAKERGLRPVEVVSVSNES